ncbi:hypothetical protein [Paenibacillus forsythiae]|uniref:hypothetical protein n=1 Tax=Paenibacillus forsythiae TaxID=365616 RepID=UPI0012ECB60D|nr:hypothetical protein [Paenibacillus forsythiae]
MKDLLALRFSSFAEQAALSEGQSHEAYITLKEKETKFMSQVRAGGEPYWICYRC